MKIGDKVRFLSDTGGGKVAGFQGKNIVLVEDSDGFQIPTPINEVVVVEEDNYTTGFRRCLYLLLRTMTKTTIPQTVL